jgi:hypothetical protein
VIVYRAQRSRADPRRFLSQLRSAVDQAGAGAPAHELVRDLLIDTGALESALADSVFADADGLDSRVDRCRSASLAIGHVFWYSWHSRRESTRRWWHRFRLALEDIQTPQLPEEVDVVRPEGYAYYSLYPEMYLQAAKRCQAVLGNFPAVCIGLRSIGSSLSAVVAASLTEMGCPVESFTVRPRGHPYARTYRIDPRLAAQMMSRPRATFLVIDEGPGISGSSIAGAVRMLHDLGIPDDRICLFPGWRTDGSHLQSPDARECWTRHRQFTGSFEEVWLESGRLTAGFAGELRDFSAGAWRGVIYPNAAAYPAVQPQHERRKYLLTSGSAAENPKLLRFAGLGRGIGARVRRAERLAAAGFTPAPERTVHGFVLQSFIAGRPVSPGEADAQLIEVMASYLAHLCRAHPSDPSVSDSSLREMIAVNVSEGLRDSKLEQRALDLPAGSWAERPVELDGRMLAHEWIRTPAGYLKVDAMDHHDDHFFPGCQDIAWDLAAAAVELALDRTAEQHLVDRYRTLSGDQTVAERLPRYSVAYLAFRLGYTRLAAGVMGESDDGKRFKKDSHRYAGLLSRRLNALSMAGSGA